MSKHVHGQLFETWQCCKLLCSVCKLLCVVQAKEVFYAHRLFAVPGWPVSAAAQCRRLRLAPRVWWRRLKRGSEMYVHLPRWQRLAGARPDQRVAEHCLHKGACSSAQFMLFKHASASHHIYYLSRQGLGSPSYTASTLRENNTSDMLSNKQGLVKAYMHSLARSAHSKRLTQDQ